MSKPIPTIMKYMSTSPHSIGTDQTVATAMDFMKEHHIRHLPILKGGRLEGVVSDRDLKMYTSLTGADPESDTVGQVLDRDVYVVSPAAALDEVAATMAEKKLGSAVVMDNHKVVGIFTVVDALKALSELLRSRLSH